MVSGKDNKVVYLPYEASGVLSSLGGIKNLFHSSLGWAAEDNNQIEMIVRSTSILLNYLHTDFRQQDYEEQENLKIMKIKTGAKKDKEKF